MSKIQLNRCCCRCRRVRLERIVYDGLNESSASLIIYAMLSDVNPHYLYLSACICDVVGRSRSVALGLHWTSLYGGRRSEQIDDKMLRTCASIAAGYDYLTPWCDVTNASRDTTVHVISFSHGASVSPARFDAIYRGCLRSPATSLVHGSVPAAAGASASVLQRLLDAASVAGA